ncbi:hypothetical protein G6O67_004657 [Ophiocordyceps sinensis]|uniref:MYG1 protein n=1 Tax=Ophiocordyceps sinensis TaxID=72228 RepID=A0A8H4V567_9HYPO|nr:hypothetical protein G6O67_004657 [Ophiocordyceps sinensis]
MTESVAKRVKTGAELGAGPLIGTHSGHFHADEALAVHMLRMLPTYRNSRLVRTRDPERLATCHTVVDVGGQYDIEARRFDHHQRGFDAVFPGRATKLSSAGLVFLHFGRAIIAQRLAAAQRTGCSDNDNDDVKTADQDTPEIHLLHRKLYTDFVEALDAHDNGIAVYDPAAIAAAGLEKRYSEAGFTLGALVGRLNLNWNDPAPADPQDAQRREDDRFLAASRRIGDEFERELDYCVAVWLPARTVVQRAFDARAAHDAQGRLLVFDGQSAPWKDHLFTLEDGRPQVLYVMYPETPEPGAKWRIQCVPESKDSFVSRKPLPEAWRGFRDDELDGIAGVPGCVFVHAAGFIGGNKTWEGVKEMAAKAVAA